MIRSAHCTAEEIRYSVRGLGRLSSRSSGVLDVPRHEDPGHNGQHTFASFVHSAVLTSLILKQLRRYTTIKAWLSVKSLEQCLFGLAFQAR